MLTTVAFKNDKIYSLSSDWLSIISYYYKIFHFQNYHDIVETINHAYKLVKMNKYTYINEDVVLFINVFSHGTGHGYVDIIVQLIYYHDNIKQYDNKRILIYDDTQQGIKDIIYFFIKQKNIILIREKELYQFKSMTFIPIKNHQILFKNIDNVDIYSNAQIYDFIKRKVILF